MLCLFLVGIWQRSLYTPLKPYTRSSSLDWHRDVLDDAVVDAVYICSPDAAHADQSYECLQAGKHALVEKPVWPNFARVSQMARQAGCVLMVGFQRRFDKEFLRLKAFAASHGSDNIAHLHFESHDPVPANVDMPFVLRNSVIHEIDLLNWVFPNSKVSFDSKQNSRSSTDAKTSSIILVGAVTHQSGARTTFEVIYSKAHTSYVQRVTVHANPTPTLPAASTQVFGYDYTPPYPQNGGEATLYHAAYQRELEEFHHMVTQNAEQCPGHKAAEEELLRSYERTFDSLDDALVALDLGTDASNNTSKL